MTVLCVLIHPLREEILDLYTHLNHLGIDNIDIRHANILQAPEVPPGWPCLVSPLSHSIYGYRLIDFEMARKTKCDVGIMEVNNERWVTRLLGGLPLGYVFEISDF